jgi:glyoxylase-like metal-dependent hydrolase (beta-lactamase superfamily II)
LINPSRLLDSARRLYGTDMDRLWGEFLAVPAVAVRELKGGEELDVAGRRLEVAYTPGHASHHVSYFDRASGVAFVGDTAGIRRGSGRYIMPPTPPPDIDLELWNASLDRVLAWAPETLFATHFGPWQDARAHIAEMRDRLADWGRRAKALVDRTDLSDEQRSTEFVRQVTQDLQRSVPAADVDLYERAGRSDYSWLGLSRYWRRKSASA